MADIPFRPVAVLILIAFFAGCAGFTPKPLLPEQTAKQFESRSLQNPALKAFMEKNLRSQISPWPPARWDINMLTLAAFYYNPDLDTARWNWKKSEAAIITAGERPNPSASFSPEYVTHLAPGNTPWVFGFSLDIPIETAGKRGYRIAEAKGLSRSARYALAASAWKVRSALRGALLDYFAAVRREDILKEQATLQAEMLALLKERLAVGQVSEPDVVTASVDYDRSLVLVREAESRIAEALAKVAGAVGVPVSALDGVDLSVGIFKTPPPLKMSSLHEFRREALTGRPDILEALARYAASQSRLQLEIAKQYPDVHIGPGYIYDQGQNKWGIGVMLELPVLNRNQGPIAEAEAARSEEAARFKALQGSIIIETEKAAAAYGSSLGQFRAADSLASEKARAVGSLKARFDVGEVDRLALNGGMVEYAAVRLERLDSLVNADRMFGLLEDALERPLGPSARTMPMPGKNTRENTR